jgi:hypothetical protein
LSRAINRPEIKAEIPKGSINLVHNFLATEARDEHKSSDDLLKHEQNLLQSAASAQEGPAAPCIDNAIDFIKEPVIESKMMG